MPIDETYEDQIETIIVNSIWENEKLTKKIKSAISEAWLESDERKYIEKKIEEVYGENGAGKKDELKRLNTLDENLKKKEHVNMDDFIDIFKKKIMVPLLVNNVLETFMKNIDENQIGDWKTEIVGKFRKRKKRTYIYNIDKTSKLVKTIIDEIEKDITINLKGKIDYSYQFEASSQQQSRSEYAGKKRLHIKFNRERDKSKPIKYDFWCHFLRETVACFDNPTTISKDITIEVMKEIVVFNEKKIESVIKSKAVKAGTAKINEMLKPTLKF